MPAARLPVRDDVDLLAADLGRSPAVWPAYQRGLHAVYAELGVGDLAMGPEPPAGATTVVVAVTPDGSLAGGVLLRDRPEAARHIGLAVAFADGVNEIGGCWVLPAWRGSGLGTALVREISRTAAGARWTVTLANQFSIGLCLRAGFVPDARFRDLPFPDDRFRSTLCWLEAR